MAMQWSLDGGLLWGQPVGEHQTERVGATLSPFVKTVPPLVRRGGRWLVG